MESRHTLKRLISMVLCLILLVQTTPLIQVASAQERTNHIPEMELPEEILSSDVFYLTASTAVLNENGGTYLLRIARLDKAGPKVNSVLEINPDAVIHCAAWTAVDLAEDDDKVALVRKVNAQGTQNIALVSHNKIISICPNWVDVDRTRSMDRLYLETELKRIKQDNLINPITIPKVIDKCIKENISSGSIIRIDGDINE